MNLTNAGVSRAIFKKCGGVPLAIITIASILVSNNQMEQRMICCTCSIQWAVGLQKTLFKKRRILLLSYYDLPSHLKTCLLYLNIFPSCPMTREVEELL